MATMQKVIFDIEDRPPPSYFKEMAKLKLESGGKDLGTKPFNAAEWCKAPEFVPKTTSQKTAKIYDPVTTTNNDKMANYVANNFDRINNAMPLVHALQEACSQQQQRQQQQQIRPRTLPVIPTVTLPSIIRSNMQTAHPLLPNGFPCQPFMQATVTQRPQRLLMNAPVQLISYSRPLLHMPATAPVVMPARLPCTFTSVNASLGAQVQAMLLKKKRKKKPKQSDEIKHNYQLMNNEPDVTLSDDTKQSSIDNLSATNTAEPHGENSSYRSNADEADGRNNKQHAYFPADLDLIQSTANCPAAFTGSWPDLSQAQRKIIDEFHEQIVTNDVNFDVNQSSSDISHSSSEEISHKKSDDEEAELLAHTVVNATENGHSYSTIDSKTSKQKNKQLMVCQTADNKRWSQVIDSSEEATHVGFIPYTLKTFSLPDVHLIATKAQRTCCSIM